MAELFHSVTLDKDKCKGCINCIKRCPTKAIRVRDGKAVTTVVGPCEVPPGWEGGDDELRTIRWDGPQYPVFPDE